MRTLIAAAVLLTATSASAGLFDDCSHTAPRNASISPTACCISNRSRRACGVSSSPAAVSAIPLLCRSNSGWPSLCSIVPISLLSAGCVMHAASAARPRLP